METAKLKLKERLYDIWDELTYHIRIACGRPTPMKRFVAVLLISAVLASVHIYFVVSSIYNMGKREAEKQFMELRHIETLKRQRKNDSINSINNYELKSKEYEYEQSNR